MTATASTAVIRQWARANGLPVGDRGRLSPQLLTAYASTSQAKPKAVKPKAARTKAARTKTGPTPAGAARRHTGQALSITVEPTPGATGTARRIVARSK